MGFTTNIPVRVIEDIRHGDITLHEHPDVRLHHHEYDARDGYKYHDPYVYWQCVHAICPINIPIHRITFCVGLSLILFLQHIAMCSW